MWLAETPTREKIGNFVQRLLPVREGLERFGGYRFATPYSQVYTSPKVSSSPLTSSQHPKRIFVNVPSIILRQSIKLWGCHWKVLGAFSLFISHIKRQLRCWYLARVILVEIMGNTPQKRGIKKQNKTHQPWEVRWKWLLEAFLLTFRSSR